MAEYRLSPAAQCDLDEIFNYTFQQWGAAQAMSYIDTLDDGIYLVRLSKLNERFLTSAANAYNPMTSVSSVTG